MLRTGRAVLAVLIAVAVVLVPNPAQAAGGLPAPVEPVPLLPSTTLRMTQGASGAWTMGDYLTAFAWANRSNSVATIPKPATVPFVAPSPSWGAKLLGGTNAGAAAFAGGFAIGGAGISLYGTLTGTDFDGAMCGAADWLQTGYGMLTLGLGPSCKASLVEPNVDADGSLVANVPGYGAWSVKNNRWCGPTADLPAQHDWWGLINGGPSAQNFDKQTNSAFRTACGTGSSAVWAGAVIYTLTRFEVRRTTDQVVVASGNVVSTSTDPLRDSTCTLTWPDNSTTTGFVGQYRESEGFPVGAVSAACTEAFVSKPGAGPGLLPSDIKVGSTNTETGAQTEIANQEVPEYTEAERKGLDAGDGTGLKLWKIKAGTTFSCMTWAIDCTNWWTETDSGTDTKTSTGTYRCTFGGKTVDLTECGVYRHTFDDPDVAAEDVTITDPEIGQPIPWPSPDPLPGPGPVPGPGPGGSDDPAGECFSNGWASVANPIDWVMVPVYCAIVKAFVPRQGKVDDFNGRMQAAWAGSAFGGMIASVGIIGAAFDGGDGCGGLPFTLGWDDHILWQGNLLAACEEPMAGVAATVKGLLTVAVIVAAIYACLRYFAGIFGFIQFGSAPYVQQPDKMQSRVKFE